MSDPPLVCTGIVGTESSADEHRSGRGLHRARGTANRVCLATLIAACVATVACGARDQRTLRESRVAWPASCDEVIATAANKRSEHVGPAAAAAREDTTTQAAPVALVQDAESITRLAPCARAIPSQPYWVVVPASGGSNQRAGLNLDGPQQLQSALSNGKTTTFPIGPVFNALAFVDGDTARVVYSEVNAAIDVVSPAPDGGYVAVVHHLSHHYSGKIVPFYLDGPFVAVIDLETLVPKVITLSVENSGMQSVLLAWERDALWIMSRNVWNGYSSDDRWVWRCEAPAFECASKPSASFPEALGYAEATASGGYRIEPLPAGFKLPEHGDRRSVRSSPDGKRVAWVKETFEEDPYGDQPGTYKRTLFVRTGTRDVPVSSGKGTLQARWLDDHELVFDAEPKMTQEWARYRVTPLTTQEAVAKLQRGPEYLALDEESKKALLEEEASEAGAERRAELAEMETLARLPRDIDPLTLQHEQLARFDSRSEKITPFHPAIKHVRLLGQPRRANVRKHGVVEVPPLGLKPTY